MLSLSLALVLICAHFASAFWRLPCNSPLVVERADSIVSPGAVSGHVHTIMGGSNFALTTEFETLRKSQCTSCAVTQDLSNYWVPSLYFQWANGTFSPVNQIGGGLIYYLQRRSNSSEQLHAFPDGFRMLAGNPFRRTYNDSNVADRATSFVCLDYSRGNGVPQTPNLPVNQGCANGLRSQVFFPSCWTGSALDSPTHNTHVAYPSGMDNGQCPPGYPVRLISLFYEVTWDAWSFEQYRSQAMNSSQPFVLASGDPTGYGMHGDFLNGWDRDVLQQAVDTCTDDSGVIEKCKVFQFNDANASCKQTPQSVIDLKCRLTRRRVNETVIGTMLPKLPGCNPVTYANAAPCADPNPPAIVKNQVYTSRYPPPGALIPPFYAPTIQTSYSSGKPSSNWTYSGLFVDSNARVLPTSMTAAAGGSSGMTVPRCLAACEAASLSVCGVEYGQECWGSSGSAIPSSANKTSDGDATSLCTGDSQRLCGAGGRLQLYVNANAAPPQTQVGPFSVLGCYTDTGSRTLSNRLGATDSMTYEACASLAGTQYRYIGLEYGRECWAGNSILGGNGQASDSSTCSMRCAGNSAQTCGGSNRLTLFASSVSSSSVPASRTSSTSSVRRTTTAKSAKKSS